VRDAANARGGLPAQPARPAAALPAAAQLLDRERYEEIRMLTDEAGPDVFGGLVRGLEKDLNAFDAGLAGWLAQKDAVTLTRAAHTLKGSSHSLGAQAMGNLFAEVEKRAKAGDIEGAGRVYTEGRKTAADSIAALDHPDALS
jgi:HPt (histidine-containing phosphotransfer) domain-containing protein